MVDSVPKSILEKPLIPQKESADSVSVAGSRASPHSHSPPAAGLEAKLDRYFRVTARGSTVPGECRAGLTAFLAASNNFVVNAHIMEHAGLSAEVSVVSGAFASGVSCILSGLLSNLPMGLVPSVGPNVFLAFSLVSQGVCTTDGALAIAGACGLLLFCISLSPALKIILALVPLSIKYGLIMGTGLLTAFIGLKSIGIVVPDMGPAHDIVALGELNNLKVHVAALALVVIASMLHRGVKGAVLIGLLGATLLYWTLSGEWPAQVVALRWITPHSIDLSVLADINMWVQVFALLLMLLFSISGAVIGSGRMAGLLREDGRVSGGTAVYITCGFGTMLSAALGSAPICVSMSAAAGIRDGGRTGLVSVVFGLLSLLTALVLSPLASAIPTCAVSPVLILVGVSMLGEAKEVTWWSMLDALPAFLCAIFQPFTYSVANGIYAGVGMSITLFFTTGTFIQYIPVLRKRCKSMDGEEASPANITEQAVHDFFLAQQSPVTKVESMPHRMGRQKSAFTRMGSIVEDEEEEEPMGKTGTFARHTIHNIGRHSHKKAMALMQRAGALLGLDADEVEEWANERICTGRCVESHCFGGIPGHESSMCLNEMDIHGMAANEAPMVVSAVRRLRTFSAGRAHSPQGA